MNMPQKLGTNSLEETCVRCDGQGEVLVAIKNVDRVELDDCKVCKGTGVITKDDPHNYDEIASF